MDITPDLLADHLEAGCRTLAADELAYLALTSKVELPVRDRLAWSRHQLLWPDHLAAREWRRIDLAVVSTANPTEPVALVQAKAMYTFNLANPVDIARYKLEIEADVRAAVTRSAAETKIFAIVLATHPTPDSTIPVALDWVVKYRPNINRSLTGDGGLAAMRLRAHEAMRNSFDSFGSVASGSLDGGTAFGMNVSLDY